MTYSNRENGIGNIIFDDGTTKIESHAYCENDEIKSLTFPISLKEIGRSAFAHCANLEKVVFTGNSVELDEFAFFNCPNLKQVVLPERVILKHRGFAFSNCDKLSDITLPKYPFDETKLSIDSGFIFHKTAWFYNYPHNFFIMDSTLIRAKTPNGSNPNIEIPKEVTSVSNGAFSSTGVKKVVFGENAKEIGARCFSNCAKLKDVILPKGIAAIEEKMFENCKNLEYVTIPSSVKQIKHNSFEDCGKVVIRAPKNSYAIAFAKECNIPFEEVGAACKDEMVTKFTDDDVNCKQIIFGKCVQAICDVAKKEPIVWDVIDETDDKMLIMSHKCLASRSDYLGKSSRWSKSGIRQWLNNQFFKQSFTPKERERILETKLVGASGKDRIFLLNSEEFNRLDPKNKFSCFSLLARKQYYEQNDCSEWNSLYAIWLLRPSLKHPTTFEIATTHGYSQYIHPREKWARGIRPAMWVKK